MHIFFSSTPCLAAVYYLAIQLYLSSAFHSGEVFDGRGLCGDNMP
jgi:hypothetical protein